MSPVQLAMNIGKSSSPSTTGTATDRGTLDTVLDLGNLGKPHVDLHVYIGDQCVDGQTHIALVAQGVDPTTIPGDCKRRPAGAFWLDKTNHVTIHTATSTISTETNGFFTPRNELILGGGGALLVTGLALAGGGDSSPGTSASPTPTPTPTPAPGGVDLTALFGTFNISATKTTDTGCNFNQTFTGQVVISGNKDGSALTLRMIESLTRTYAGTMGSNGTYSGTGTGNLNGFAYNGTIIGTATSTTISGSETLNFSTGCPGRSVIYNFTGTK